jgi:hypothetical protein
LLLIASVFNANTLFKYVLTLEWNKLHGSALHLSTHLQRGLSTLVQRGISTLVQRGISTLVERGAARAAAALLINNE